MKCRVAMLLVLAGCQPSSASHASRPRAASTKRVPPAITFEWRGHELATNVGVTGALTLVDEFVPRLVIRGLPLTAIISGDVHEASRDDGVTMLEVSIAAPLASVSVAARAPIDPLARFTITLADGRTGTTSIPPIPLSDQMLWSWLGTHDDVHPGSSPRDSMIYFDAERHLALFGHHGTLGDIDVVAALDTRPVSSMQCTYVIPIDRGEDRRTITVFANETTLAIRDRRTARVLAETSWPAPARCPAFADLELSGPIDHPHGQSAVGAREIRGWLEAWRRLHMTM